MLFFWAVCVTVLLTDGFAWQGVGGAILFLPLGALGLYWCLKRTPAIVIDAQGVRSPFFSGWNVRWDEVETAALERRRVRYFVWKTLVMRVRDPDAVVRRLPPKRRRGKRAARLRAHLERDGVRFALHYLDTPRDDILAAVERYVPVAR